MYTSGLRGGLGKSDSVVLPSITVDLIGYQILCLPSFCKMGVRGKNNVPVLKHAHFFR